MTSTAAVLTVMTRRNPRHDALGGAIKTLETTKVSQTILANSWDIPDRDKLVSTLEWLRDAGHREGRHPQADDGLGPNGLLAWDFVRLIAVAGWGYLAEYITADEAWDFVDPAARELQQAYGSWNQLGDAYAKGTYDWSEEAGPGCQKIVNGLKSDPNSPWRTLPWGLDLDQKDQGAGGDIAAARATSYALYIGIGLAVVAIVGGVAAKALSGAAKDVRGAISDLKTATASEPSNPATPNAPAPSKSWDGKSALNCSGNMDLTIENVTANLDGQTAIAAIGNCHLLLKGVTLKAATGLSAGGNAQVTIEGGAIAGSTAAITALGNAKVSLTGTKLTGAVQHLGNAKVTGP